MLLFAHRGAPQLRAENTLPSFAAAVAAGADVLELDVRATADDVLVVLHDARLERTTDGAGPVAQLPWAYVARLVAREPAAARANVAPTGVPRLIDVLRAWPHARFNVDLKDLPTRLVPQVVATLRWARAEVGRRQDVRLTSAAQAVQRALDACLLQDDHVARGMGARDVAQVLLASRLGLRPPAWLRNRACQMPVASYILGRRIGWITPRLIATLAQLHAPLHVWGAPAVGIDDPSQVDALGQAGVDGVFTDAVHVLRRFVAAGA